MTIEEVLHQNLTDTQFNAAMDPANEILCLACAGSGKSRTLAYRIARLIAEGADPTRIVAFTFTNKAAESIKHNVARALSSLDQDPLLIGAMFIGTIHSYCQYILTQIDARYRQFDVLDDNRLKLFLISRYRDIGIVNIRNDRSNGNRQPYYKTINEVASAWEIINHELIDIQDINEYDPIMGEILENIRNSLDINEFIDYSQMIRLVVEYLRENNEGAIRATRNLQHLLVDEYQDVNTAENALIQELHRNSSTLFVVGDDDQSIYGWRGADVHNILSFGERYGIQHPHVLGFNYRSTQSIVETSDRFIHDQLGPDRIEKNPSASNPEGPRDIRKLWFNRREDEANWIGRKIEQLYGTQYIERNGNLRGLTYSDFAIMMRSTRKSEGDDSHCHSLFTEVLSNLGIRYTLEAGGGIFSRPEISALRDALNLLHDRSPTRSEARIFFDVSVSPIYPQAVFNTFTNVLSFWGREIHAPVEGGARRRIFPQKILHEIMESFGINQGGIDEGIMKDIGVFSSILKDVESVYPSIDSTRRFQDVIHFLYQVAERGYDSSTDEILRRPDAVNISTVHKMKGLEYPVVFVADVESRRFPLDQRRYNGWLPREIIQMALDRDCYQSTTKEEARLFYTAMTRAERFLYVTGSQILPGNIEKSRSRFFIGLNHEELLQDEDESTPNLIPQEPSPRIDEIIVPTTYSDIKYYLRCPKSYQFRKSFGFSPPINEMFGFGKTVHTTISKIHELYSDTAPDTIQADEIVADNFHLKHVYPSSDPEERPGPYERAFESARIMTRNYIENYSEDFEHQRVVEQPFEVPLENAVISGSIDLIIRIDDEENIIDACVIDFKTMEGGEIPEENDRLNWTELSLQVQLYAMAVREILGENARTGAVHLLKDNTRVFVPISDEAIQSARSNVEWAVNGILSGEFPMRPHHDKCEHCDFKLICPKLPEDFTSDDMPPPVYIPSGNNRFISCFEEFER